MSTPTLPKILLDLPAGFTAVRLDTAAEDRYERARGLVNDALTSDRAPEAGQAGPAELTRAVASWFDELASVNVLLFGKFAVPDTEGPALATLALAVTPLDMPDPDRAAADLPALASGIVEILSRAHPEADCRVVRLPVGPAVAAVFAGSYRWPTEVTGLPEEVVRRSLRGQFQIPLPTGDHVAVLDVSTDSDTAWPEVCRTAVTVARSLRLEASGDD